MSLLAERRCDVFFYVNSPTAAGIPAYGRIRGFEDFCREHSLPNEIFIEDMGVQHATAAPAIERIFTYIERKYPQQRKGIFHSDDTRANEMLNCIVRKYGTFPDSYRLVGFDNSPVAERAVFPITTVGQQIDVIAREAVSLLVGMIENKKNDPSGDRPSIVHKVITPVLMKRATTEGVTGGLL